MSHNNSFVTLCENARQHIQELSPQEVSLWQEQNKDFTLIDVREDHEWEQAGIVGATHIGRGVLERDISRLIPDTNRHLVLYCGGGYRSALAALSLQQMGYHHVWSMAGGFRQWAQEHKPIQHADKAEK